MNSSWENNIFCVFISILMFGSMHKQDNCLLMFCGEPLILQTFLDGERANAYLTTDVRNELLLSAATEVTGRYNELASDLVNVVSTLS